MPVKYTNPSGIPPEFEAAIKNSRHRLLGDISVTTLIDSPQIAELKRKHTYEQDVADMVKALMGTALHQILEDSNTQHRQVLAIKKALGTLTDHIVMMKGEAATTARAGLLALEQSARQIFGVFDNDDVLSEHSMVMKAANGLTISGTNDWYSKKTKTLRDYKSTSVWAYIFEGKDKKWEQQTNIYAEMLRANGHEVEKIEIIRLFTDWSASKRHSSLDYPPSSIMELRLPVWPREQAQAYINERADLHKQAREGGPMHCSDQDTWYTKDSFAVMKPSAKRATRVFSTPEAAEAFVTSTPGNFQIDRRPGVHRRCIMFCPVAPFCDQLKGELSRTGSTIEQERAKLGQ